MLFVMAFIEIFSSSYLNELSNFCKTFLLFYLQRSESNHSKVLLTGVPNSIAGKYSCEVSADAPTFNTAIDAGEMEVVGIKLEHFL